MEVGVLAVERGLPGDPEGQLQGREGGRAGAVLFFPSQFFMAGSEGGPHKPRFRVPSRVGHVQDSTNERITK